MNSYSDSKYVNNRTKINISCIKHGNYWQTPSNHLSGKGCRKCAVEKRAKKRSRSIEDFTTIASSVHNGKYSYDKTVYVRSHSKIIITCPIHGNFKQTPANHLKNNGCPRCRDSRGECILSTILDTYKIKYIREYKITPFKYKYDFYLPEYNIYIEYHGIQHYKKVPVFGGEPEFKKCIKRDKIKIELIKRSSGLLIIIKYTFDTLVKIEDEISRIFYVIHPDFFTNKESVKRHIESNKIFLIKNGICYRRS